MTEETRRSGRATKGQHTKDKEMNEAPAAAKKKGTAKKAAKKQVEVEEEEEEGEEKIRCVCGEYEEETDEPRDMICCDNCEVWQHNDCMGLAEGFVPEKYFCEECKPGDHKELLAAMKKGQKPWEQAAKKRAEMLEANKKGKKGKKGGRKSAAAEDSPAPSSTPTAAGQKRKAEESPAPSETKNTTKKAKSTPQATPSAEPKEPTTARGRKAAASATPVPPTPSPAPPKDPKELPQTRQGAASGLVKVFTEQTKVAVKDGFNLPMNQNANLFGQYLGMAVEAAIYQYSTTTPNESDTYKSQVSAILINIKRNSALAGRIIRSELHPDQLASMPSSAMASEEQQRKDAEMQAQLDKQSTLVGTEEQGPRIRRTHKGDEYVEDLNKPAPEATEQKPSQRQASTAEVKSPTHSRRPPSVTIPNRRPSTDPRRQSSGNFDLNSVYSNIQGSPVGDQRFGEIQQTSREPVGPGARPDADIDNLLKDEDEVESPPYSPRADNDDSVWRGLINGGNVGRFHNGFKFAAGAPIDAPTLRLTWEQLLPSEIGISGRIDPKKAEDYLCGLEFSNTSDLIVLWMSAPNNSGEASQFNNFFEYFKTRDRYGVGSQQHNPALKDIYFIPVDKGQSVPLFLASLQSDFPTEAAERMILVPLVIKNSELPRNVGESPAVGGAVMQTPITPRESFVGVDGATNGGVPTPYAAPTPVPVNGNSGGYPQQQQFPPAAPQPPQQAAPQQSALPPNASPAQQAAYMILGPQMSLAPAVQQLCQTAPNAGEQEMNIVKECILENPVAGEQLSVLTNMLAQKWAAGQSNDPAPAAQVQGEGQPAQAQAQEAAATTASVTPAAAEGTNGVAAGSS